MSTTPADHLKALAGTDRFSEASVAFLEQPRRSITINTPLVLDSGEERMITGYRVQYDDTLGPTKGGMRIHPHADLDDVNELAFLMTLKTSLTGLPYGGAKGAIRIDPKALSKGELERAIRAFTRELAPFIGEDRDIPAPDVNTDGETMRIMLDEYEKTIGTKSPSTFTGKAVADGGTLGRAEATGQGGFYVLEAFLDGKTPSDTRVAIQGFGNVGMHLAQFLFDAGYKVIAVSDSSAGIHDDNGLQIPELIAWKEAGERFLNYKGVEKISNEELLELPCDVLAPSALGGVITAENAAGVQAPVILEMANGPITPEADAILDAKGVMVIPDILANSGGVIVSYFEWLQNKRSETWTKERVNEELKRMIINAADRVKARKTDSVSLRTASYVEAILRIVEERKKTRQ